MSVANELKQKRAALTERLQEIAREQVEVQELMVALDRVIPIYQSDYKASPMAGSSRLGRPRMAPSLSPELNATTGG